MILTNDEVVRKVYLVIMLTLIQCFVLPLKGAQTNAACPHSAYTVSSIFTVFGALQASEMLFADEIFDYNIHPNRGKPVFDTLFAALYDTASKTLSFNPSIAYQAKDTAKARLTGPLTPLSYFKATNATAAFKEKSMGFHISAQKDIKNVDQNQFLLQLVITSDAKIRLYKYEDGRRQEIDYGIPIDVNIGDVLTLELDSNYKAVCYLNDVKFYQAPKRFENVVYAYFTLTKISAFSNIESSFEDIEAFQSSGLSDAFAYSAYDVPIQQLPHYFGGCNDGFSTKATPEVYADAYVGESGDGFASNSFEQVSYMPHYYGGDADGFVKDGTLFSSGRLFRGGKSDGYGVDGIEYHVLVPRYLGGDADGFVSLAPPIILYDAYLGDTAD
ncbi:MAG: hypothetical protein RR328_06230, partial [Bacteroidales bacterium]